MCLQYYSSWVRDFFYSNEGEEENKMIAIHQITEIKFGGKDMFINVDGKSIKVQLLKVSEKLSAATEIERTFYKISPSGYGVHWPLIDEDLSLNQILAMQNA